MLSEKLLKTLNEQITHELYASHLYIAMAAHCESIDLEGCANFFLMQAEEEKFHAMKIYHYINDMDGEVVLEALENPYRKYDSVLDVFESALAHEKIVTGKIYDLMEIAVDEREYATVSFLNWFVDEQVEEEASFKTLIQKFKVAINDEGMLHMLDNELGTRVFTPPNPEE
ncbi:MAG TPA: ferritin [Erysipelotrichaceae bacterium]|nr:ferritin [Erysipelotrichaceae bacterium]